jgi:small conductance mechanosensitive channel
MATSPFAFAATTAPVLAPHVDALLSGKVDWNADMLSRLTGWAFSSGLTVVLVLAVTALAARAYGAGLDHVFRLINGNIKPDALARVAQRTNTLQAILSSLGRAVILFLGGMVALAHLGVNIAPILASAGIVGVAVGFGAQSLVKDVINGFFILVEDQYGVGDTIEIGAKTGLVERMNLRITQIRTLDGQLITVPNGQIQTVTNHSKEWARAVLEIPVDYAVDPERVIAVLRDVGEALRAELPEKVLEPIEVLGLEAFRDADYTVKLAIKTRPSEQWSVARAFRQKLWGRFRAEGLDFPFPHTKISLQGAPAGESAEAAATLLLRAADPARPGAGQG